MEAAVHNHPSEGGYYKMIIVVRTNRNMMTLIDINGRRLIYLFYSSTVGYDENTKKSQIFY